MAHQASSENPPRRGPGLANSDVLGPSVLDFPPTLNDIGYPLLPKFISRIYSIVDKLPVAKLPTAWENSQVLADLLWQHQLDDRLPPPTAEESSVYLVTAARGHPRRSYGHWSFYSQGYFFHLTAPRSGKDQLEEASCETKSPAPQLLRLNPVGLKIQNLANPDEAEFVHPTENTRRTALQAYHVGHTRFNPHQLQQLAIYVITTLETYSFFERNCQLFVISMLNRTVMSRRDFSIFVGDIHQIAEWDLRGKAVGGHHYSKATGYLLLKPRIMPTNRHTIAELRHVWPFVLWTGIGIIRRSKRIATLYRHGESAMGAFDPSGQREGMRLAIHLLWHDMKSVLPTEQQVEIWDDLKHKRWHHALFGRPERRKSSYLRLEERAKSGDDMTKMLLPFHRWCFNVTEDERRIWLQEIAVDPI